MAYILIILKKHLMDIFLQSNNTKLINFEKRIIREQALNPIEALREKRATIAEDMGVPAYIIFNDKTLKYLASEKPDDKESMLEINGIGEKKYNSFGEEFLKIIKIYKI